MVKYLKEKEYPVEGERGIRVLGRGLEYLEERVRVPGSGDYDRARGVRVPGESGYEYHGERL